MARKRARWSDWYREFVALAKQAGISPDTYEGTTGQGDELVAAYFRAGETPQSAVKRLGGVQERRAGHETLATAKAKLAPVGYLVKRTDHDDYRVYPKGTKDSDLGYFTDDLDDAVATGIAMAQKGASVVRTSRQQHLPGIEPGDEPVEIEIPTMGWEQINGDVDPGAHGGTIATADGDHIELIKIQPVREYVGDDEAKDVGFPFWTKTAWFDLGDLDPNDDDVKSAMSSVGLDRDALEDMEPTQRALALADALFDYGRGDEGPAGWSSDIGIPDKVKWMNGDVAGSEYLADEDDAFVRDVLLTDLAVDYEHYGPDEENPTSGLKVDGGMSGVEITEWTDIEDANGEEQPEGEKVVKQSATVDLEELIGPGKHVGAYSGFHKAVTLAELAQMDPEDQEKTIVAAAIAYLAYHGGEEEFVDAIGD